MIKLIQLLREVTNSPKAIIMAGGAGSGKTTFTNNIKSDLKKNNWNIFNPDNYIEGKKSFPDDFTYISGPKKGQKRDINLSNASLYIKNTEIPNSIANKQNFLYDTTAADVQGILDIVNSPEYKNNVKMVMLYAHPIVSFLRNFKRTERMVPAVGVITSWNSVYKTINQYSNALGNNFYLVSTGVSPEEQLQIEEFNEAYAKGKLKEFFESLLKTGNFKSTFRKDPSTPKSPEEIAKTKILFNKQIDELTKQFEIVQNDIEQIPNENKDYSEVINVMKQFINS